MKKFKLYYQGARKSNELKGWFKNRRVMVIEYDEEVMYHRDKLKAVLRKLAIEFGNDVTRPDCGYAYVRVDNVEEFYMLRKEFRNIEKSMKYYDPEYDRIVSEEVVKAQYNKFKEYPWFHESYEKFLADEFEEI